jgi:hypothetical protein
MQYNWFVYWLKTKYLAHKNVGQSATDIQNLMTHVKKLSHNTPMEAQCGENV